MADVVQFGHERLDVYRVAIQFVAWAGTLLEGSLKKSGLSAVSQLDRASTSIPLNIAEGNAKRSKRDKGKFLDIANGSAFECAAALDVLVARSALSPDQVLSGKALLVRIVEMLTKMTLKLLGPDAYR